MVAGGRRLVALKALAGDGVIDADHPVPCLVAADPAMAGELSLAENIVRIAMHPADQVTAFTRLANADLSVAASAARFGTSERLVEQRLRLGNVAPIQGRRQRFEEHRDALGASGEGRLSLTDSDSRAMHTATRVGVGYDIQIAVNAKHKLNAEQQVHNKVSDLGLLPETAVAARRNLAVDQVDAVADAGYFKIENIEACENAGVMPHVPKPQRGSTVSQGLLPKERFRNDGGEDIYICPDGQCLALHSKRKRRGIFFASYANRAACKECQLKSKCTKSAFRRVLRYVDEAIQERMAERLAARPELSPDAGGGSGFGLAGAGVDRDVTNTMSVNRQAESTRSSAAVSRRSTVRRYLRLTAATRLAKQHRFIGGSHSAASRAHLSEAPQRFTAGAARVRLSGSRAKRRRVARSAARRPLSCALQTATMCSMSVWRVFGKYRPV